MFKLRALPESVRPLPVKSLNDSPLTMRLVVEAVMKEEYIVEEEYGEITEVPKYPVLGLVAPLAPISYELSVNKRLPVKVPPVKERSSEA
jgi:SOS-response transcriptional repressor LexA